MCGIVGILNNKECSQQDSLRSIARAMMEKIHHRGPDASGSIDHDYGVLGHKRLSIIDLEHGHQPMVSADNRYALIFNGEIYNYIELRIELQQKGVVFSTFSDTEVLLNALIVYGKGAIPKLNGMFAFCFLDKLSGDWILCRDHFGIKPLYYVSLHDQLYFSSEIKSFQAIPDFRSEINKNGLNQYFTFQFCLGKNTLFRGVNKVEPGTFLTGSGSTIHKSTTYWTTDYHSDETHTENYFLEKLGFLLKDSARLQIRSDVPLGAYLSGGLDSSLVSTLASVIVKDNIPLFTGKFLEGVEYDETHFARDVCDRVKGEMHEVAPSANDFVDHLPRIMSIMDEPVAGPGVFPQYMVSREASKYVKVVLGGQGGDEIFGGYARYLVGYLEQALKANITGVNDEGGSAVDLASLIPNLPLLRQYKPMLSNFWKNGLFDSMESRYFRLVDRSPDLENILSADAYACFDRESVFSDFKQIFNDINSDSYVNKMTNFDLKTLLPALLHVEDRVSMAASIESRVPLLDPRIVDLVSSVPPSIKFDGGGSKSLLRKAAKNILPISVLKRKDKMGFPVPLNEWMRSGPVRDFVMDTLTSQKSIERGIYKKEVLKNAGSYSGVGARQLWGMLSLELWHQSYIDRKMG